MTRWVARLRAGCILPAVLWLPLTSGAAPEDLRGRRLADALGLDCTQVEALDAPAAELLRDVAERSDGTPADLIGATVYRYRPRAGRFAVGYLACLPTRDPALGFACVVAMVEKHRFVAGTIVDERDRGIEEWDYFFHQLPLRVAPDIETAPPPSELAYLEGELTDQGDSESLGTLAQMRLLRLMQEQARAFNLPSVRNREPVAAELRSYEQIYREVASLRPALAHLLGPVADPFEALALDSAGAYATLARATEQGDPMDSALRDKIFQNCTTCHDLKLPGGALLHDRSAELRAAQGVGDGFLRVGYDLRLRHDEVERSQRAAARMRQVTLLASAYLTD